ncbi:MAG: ParA family protein [Spirochaetia bacterium]|nr:ParA family protein [Spirochaetia bacterium]
MSIKKIVFANQKGGVGKTTTTANLGAYLAELGQKVLLIDLDPQGNLTSAVGADDERPGMYEVLTDEVALTEAIQETPVERLFVVGSNIDLTGINIELVNAYRREYYLDKHLNLLGDEWDYILIDCPPSLGLLTLNGLVAADYSIIPLQCEYFALEGLSMLVRTIMNVKKHLNQELEILGIVFTMYDNRTRLAQDVVKDVSDYFKDKVFESLIPRNVRLSEAPSHGLPINLYDPACKGAESYLNLAKEVLQRG